jgi:hypothetical protein
LDDDVSRLRRSIVTLRLPARSRCSRRHYSTPDFGVEWAKTHDPVVSYHANRTLPTILT